jgi:hypothetical protein
MFQNGPLYINEFSILKAYPINTYDMEVAEIEIIVTNRIKL